MEVTDTSVDDMKRRLKNEQGMTKDSSGGVDNAPLDFYDFLLVNWVGISTTEIPADDYLVEDTTSSLLETDEEYTPAGDYKGPHCKVKGGMSEALRPLISKVEGCVDLRERVTRIQDRGHDIIV
jgi:hypothetical protein